MVIPDVIVVRTFTDGIDEITKVDHEWRFGLDLPHLRWPACIPYRAGGNRGSMTGHRSITGITPSRPTEYKIGT
ncbi:MAG: hypothetical protein EOO27_27630 [Comamonadaceae bacterium]|nr:MAG: hypothetical protein EOO27_27630 [Comamonadaceae bacterium]